MDDTEAAIYAKQRGTQGLGLFDSAVARDKDPITPRPDSVAANSQAGLVLKHLQSGRTLTSLEALNLFGSLRLAALIWSLRNKGYDIQSRLITVGGHKQVSEYRLLPKEIDSLTQQG
jgi:hypothetical protein